MIDDELRRAAEHETRDITPETLRPLRLPERRRRAAGRWLLPATAATALAAVVLTVFVTVRDVTPRGPAAGSTPPFFISVSDSAASSAGIFDARTGERTGTVGITEPTAGASTPDPHTFLVTTGQNCTSRLYRVRVGDSGHVTTVRPIADRLPVTVDLDGLAVSPDGTRAALSGYGCGRGILTVIDLRTGHTWTLTTGSSKRAGFAPMRGLAWAHDSRMLLFTAYDRMAGKDMIYTMNPTTGGGTAAIAGVVRPATSPSVSRTTGFAATSDDHTFWAVQISADRTTVRVVRYRLSDGRRLGVAMRFPNRGYEPPYWVDPTGHHLRARNRDGMWRIDDGRRYRLEME